VILGRVALALVVATVAWVPAAPAQAGRPAFRLRVLRLVDHSRRAYFGNGGSAPRVLATYVRVPTTHRPPFPLVVFAHGFTLTPGVYAELLDTWARAGYLVAAPLFPVENANAQGGPDERDLVNEPRDLSFVLSRLTAATGPLRGLVDPTRVAFAGQSDGAVAALEAAYDRRYLDRRVDAALVLSGATFPGFARPLPGAPPLLAVQGTADPINSPSTTAGYYQLMRPPKYLLWLLGAAHLPPYTSADRWATVVDRATVAFLDHALRGAPLGPLLEAGTQPGVARIVSDP
jgi:dienelactone hydrolase